MFRSFDQSDHSISSKVAVFLGKQPAVFTFNSSQHIQCHLQLRSPSQFGFFVFFDTLLITNTTDCEQDFVQFGKDFLFFTSIKSKKFCRRLSAHEDDDNQWSRHYVDNLDSNQMDVWIKVSQGTGNKQIKIIVTPVLKTCGKHELWWTHCRYVGSYL